MKHNRYTKEKIYDLLPSIYKIKDKEEGEPLKALLEIIGEQVEFIEDDIEHLYNNWFIETCDEWLVPYIGDLLQARILNQITKITSSHRSWVANTISYRRRKGTLASLEQLSRDVTGWNCHVVEFMQNLLTTQYLNHLRLDHKATVNLRNKEGLELMGTPFDSSAHTLDVRNISSKRGYYNIPNIGIFLWRLQSYPVINAPAFSIGEGKYTFSQLGYDLPIYNHPQTEPSKDQIAVAELNVPSKIKRTTLKKYIDIYKIFKRNFAYEHSIKIVKSVLDQTQNQGVLESQVSPQDIIVCNLSNWNNHNFLFPPSEKVAIDPELGRIVFSDPEQKIVDVHVSYYYGFSGEIGGCFYERNEPNISPTMPTAKTITEILSNDQKEFFHYKISKKNNDGISVYGTLYAAIEKWNTEEFRDKQDVVFEIIDSETYVDYGIENGHTIIANSLEIDIPENITVVLKSQQLQRPTLILSHPILIRGSERSRLAIDGILFAHNVADTSIPAENNQVLYDNNNILLKILKGNLLELVINHCTFVPARSELENQGRFLLSWDNLLQSQIDTERLKKFLFDILGEEWLKGNNVVLSKNGDEGTSNPKIIISQSSSPSPDTSTGAIAPIILDFDSTLGIISINRKYSDGNNDNDNDEEQQNYYTIYKLPVVKDANNLTNVYTSTYNIGIFGNNVYNDTSTVNNDSLTVSINGSIVGRIDLSSCLASIKITDSIVDGKGIIEAIKSYFTNIQNSTIFGKLYSEGLEMASNSIFMDTLYIERRQQGCVRFCYIPHGSMIPRPYRCILENDLPSQSNLGQISQTLYGQSLLPIQVSPQFTSLRYGDEGYGQLYKDIDKKIFEGADNGSELGAFNHLLNPQRIKNLELSLDEYLKFGLKAGIFLVT